MRQPPAKRKSQKRPPRAERPRLSRSTLLIGSTAAIARRRSRRVVAARSVAHRSSRRRIEKCRRRSSWEAKRAGRVIPLKASAGLDRITARRWRWRQTRASSQGSIIRKSRPAASLRPSIEGTASSSSTLMVRTGARRLRDHVHVRRGSAAAVPRRAARGRLQALTTAWDGRARRGRRPALVQPLPGRDARATTSCTGPGRRRTGTTCARTATRRTSARTTTPRRTLRDHVVRDQRGVRGVPRPGISAPGLGTRPARPTTRATARD